MAVLRIVLFPGLALPPGRYEPMLDALASALGVETTGYCCAGVGDRVRDRKPVDPEGMAAEALARFPDEGEARILVGHSAGAHAARAAARRDPRARALVLLDPNLGASGPYDPADFDVPDGMSGWPELEETYAAAGVPSEHVLREWWRERPDGSLARAFDLETIRTGIAAVPHGPAIVAEMRALAARLPVAVVRTTLRSVNSDEAWDALAADAPEIEVFDVPVHHVLPRSEQPAVAERVATWIATVPERTGPPREERGQT